MAIVACPPVRRSGGLRALAVGVAVLAASCQPAPSATPSATAGATGTPSFGPTGSPAATTTAECRGIQLPDIAPPITPADSWDRRTFYEIFVRSFADSDGDGVGDIAGMTSKLDYLNDGDPGGGGDLGISGIWLMPVAEARSYHGYDVTDYTAVEQDYGSLEDLREFVNAAHGRDVKVILDFVVNHTSSEHPWFVDALAGGKHRDWYIWSDDNPHWPSVAGGNPWHQTAAGDWYYGAFWEGMPDLNLRNPEVTAELERIARFWLDEVGVDGFRIDAAKHLLEDDGQHQINTQATLDWLEDFKASIHADRPDALVIGEVFDIATLAGRYVPDSLDLTFDFGLAGAFRQALQTGRAAPIRTALSETLTSWPAGRQAPFLTNHDQERIRSQLNGDFVSSRLAAGMLLTSPGVPFIYYGEEIGMQGRKPDERIRTPMQWSADGPSAGFSTGEAWEPLADDWQTVNVAAEEDDSFSLLSTYRNAIRFRAQNGGLTDGQTYVVDGGAEPVIGWIRASGPGSATLVVVNVASHPVTDYGLTLEVGPLCGITSARMVGQLNDLGEIVPGDPIVVTDRGGLAGAKPIAELAPRGGYVFELGQ